MRTGRSDSGNTEDDTCGYHAVTQKRTGMRRTRNSDIVVVEKCLDAKYRGKRRRKSIRRGSEDSSFAVRERLSEPSANQAAEGDTSKQRANNESCGAMMADMHPSSDVLVKAAPKERGTRVLEGQESENLSNDVPAKVEDEEGESCRPKKLRRSRRSTRKVSPYFEDSVYPLESTSSKKRSKAGRTKITGGKKLRKSGLPANIDDLEEVLDGISNRQPISENVFGLAQELYAPDPLRVLIVAMFCNQTPGSRARPFLTRLFEKYPDAEALSKADHAELEEEIRPLGLSNVRAKRLIQLGTQWLVQPPVAGQVSPRKGLAKKIGYPDTEVSHLPGCGPYAMDCYRLFCTNDGWRNVRPDDKELKPYVKWRWSKEGIDYHQLLRDDPSVR